jgi:hypothetical protein
MAYTKISGRRNVNSLTKKIPYWKMPIGIKIVGLLKELLSIAC